MDDLDGVSVDFDDDSAAFLSNLTGEPIPAKPGAEEDNEAETVEALETTSASPEADPAKEADPDDAELEWGDEGSKSKAKMSELKAAFLARSESTRVSTEAAEARTQALAQSAQASTALNSLLTKAQAKWEPFSKLDFLALSKDPSISPEDFTALRAAAQEALTDYRYLTTELEGAQKAQQATAQAANAQATQECIRELSDPVKGIPGFGKDLYNSLVEHAVASGAPREAVLAINSPWALKVLNDARLYREGLKAAEGKVAKVVNKNKGAMVPGAGSAPKTGMKQAMSNLRSSHSVDDAADAFLASFGA